MKSRKELIEQHEHLLKVYNKVKDLLAGYPNVVDIGIGVKEKKGSLTEEGCIKIIVTDKKREEDLEPNQVIPKEIEGVKTDIIIQTDKLPLAVCTEDQDSYRPIKGGIMISNQRNGSGTGGSGTLGCLAQLNSDDSWVILSNHHVLYGTNGQDGDDIGQPWVGCSWCCKTNLIAKNLDKNVGLDCAIARVNNDINISNTIDDIGAIENGAAVAAVTGERVRKKGARTGYTSGTISLINPSNKEITITPNTPGGPDNDPGGCTNYVTDTTIFAFYGDSGSVVLNDNNEVVALLYSGSSDFTRFYASDILQVQTALEITIKTTSSTPGTPLANFSSQNEDYTHGQLKKDKEWVDYLEERLEETTTGKEILKVFRQHEKEVFFLVNQQRPVTVTWQRKQGPVFLAAFGRSVKHKDFKIPEEINRVSLQNLLMSMATILEEHGSTLLVDDIQKYALEIIRISKICHTADEYLQFISQLHTPIESPQ